LSRTPQPAREITHWLTEWGKGDALAGERLAEAVYPELRRIAGRFLNNERADHTLEPSALVNELWMRLVASDPIIFQNRAHFWAVASQTMRRILIDHARTRVREKRGGRQQQISFAAVEGWNVLTRDEDLLDLDRALTLLAGADSRAARVVELRFFGGLQEDEVAGLLGVSLITVKRDWKVARAWLLSRLTSKVHGPNIQS
jgi:RNA polymerase sigma-70 factor (ECF subfamily)